MTDRNRVRIRYSGGRAVTVIGPATGERYTFTGTERISLVHPKDAFAILRSPSFRVVGIV